MGPIYDMQASPRQEWQHKSLVCYVGQEGSEEVSDAEKGEEVMAEKDVRVTAEERLEKIDLGSNPQEAKPISINSKLSEEEKSELILLLKEFKDIFA